ncbi:nitrate- and nitrite sensing domain-containing protein [Streptomyces sp. DASNCL29]|uniref:nitrate- and nitrite sensing domain-containing protein n=1 Tax=Streptomyces sp. DASNCL29 TaxID=2583819 RepID=UPI00110F9E09|nr:nitrate- and nitrite sensing domain-containing protein [Streptomyces sp. DASNCL29]TMU92409.1 HAMP domain-containing protein [Streptomyces sp. DASNCL29]
MRKKRLRGTTREAVGEPRQDEAAPRRRTVRVRRRLTTSVVLVSVAVLGAGTPAVLLALDDTTDAQHLVDLAETNRGAVTLAHALADERDAMTRYVADGRTSASGRGVSEEMRARVDRRVREVRGDVPASVRRRLDALPELRQEALTGKGSATDVFTAYTRTVQALNGITDTLARRLPADAESGGTAALAPLGRAVEEASATRGLLLAALDAGGGQPTLVSAAQRTNVREQSALDDFEQLAPAAMGEAYQRTVSGAEVGSAERYLARLTDQGRLAGNDFFLQKDRVEAALNARIDQMRGAQSSLASAEAAQLARVRDDEVTDLELRIGIVGAALLVALGAGVHSARSMTRPLAALRLGARRVAADPAAEEPVAFKGRDDEFADAVRAINELHAKATQTYERVAELERERTRLVGERQRVADERDGLRAERDAVATRLEGLRARVHGSFVSLALRSLGLIERQLAIIESLEEREQDPDRLETLFQLDHLATGMRRYGENLLVIAGSEQKATHPGPVPLLDVLRASISEVERYDRVQIQALPPHAQVAGFAADSVSHLIAELLENATPFSPPDAAVQISGWLLETGEVMLSVQDEGIGMTPERFVELNNRLADPVPEYCQGPQPEDPLGLGLYVVTRLAARHGIRVQLREQQPGGVAAVVVLPTKILPSGPPGAGLPPAPPVGAGATFGATGPSSFLGFPGSEAEANSNALPGQARSVARDQEGVAGADAEPIAPPAEPVPEPDPVPQAAEPGPEDEPRTVPEPRTEPDPVDAAAEPEPSAPWAVPGARWGLTGDTGRDYPMEPTPPRGHPAPEGAGAPAPDGAGAPAPDGAGALPALPKRVPKLAQADGPEGARSDADDKAPAPRPEEPEVPAVEQTMELTLRRLRESQGDPEDRDGRSDRTGPDGRESREGREDRRDREGRDVRADTADTADRADADRRDDRPDPGDHADREWYIGGHGIRPVGAAAWGPAHGGPASYDGPEDSVPSPPGGRTAEGGERAGGGEPSADPYAIGPDQHARPDDEPMRTDKGLPKRRPRNVALREPDARERTGSVNAEELRRRLGGFQRGAREGHRDAAAEIAAHGEPARGHGGAAGQTGAQNEGGTVEEARG